jgi:hypothetical protein
MRFNFRSDGPVETVPIPVRQSVCIEDPSNFDDATGVAASSSSAVVEGTKAFTINATGEGWVLADSDATVQAILASDRGVVWDSGMVVADAAWKQLTDVGAGSYSLRAERQIGYDTFVGAVLAEFPTEPGTA